MDEKHLLHRIVSKKHFDENDGVRIEAFRPTDQDKQSDGSYHLSVIAGSDKPAEEACSEHATKFSKDVAGCVAFCQSDDETIEIMKTKLEVLNDKDGSAHRSIVIPNNFVENPKKIRSTVAKLLYGLARRNGVNVNNGLYYACDMAKS